MRRATAALWLLALAMTVLQAWALSSVYFGISLDGDIVYPEHFVRDALWGEFPLSGWTLSSAPYFFPDFLVLGILALSDVAEPVTPLYPLIFYPALALACGAVLRRVTPAGWGAWLAGALVVNVLLVCDQWTDHARGLWWLGGPGLHGGAVLLGLCSLALWFGPVAEPLSHRRWILALVLTVAGVVSDTLLLTQFLLPLACGFLLANGIRNWRAPRLQQLWLSLVLALAAVLVCRVGVQLAGGWRFSGVFRYAPLPSVWRDAARAMGRDILGNVARDQGWMLMLAATGLALGIWNWRRSGRDERRVFDRFVIAALVSTVALPVFSGYWNNSQHARYLLPLFVVPALWGAAALLQRDWRARGAGLAVVAFGLAVVGVKAAREARRDFAGLPHSEDVARLEAWARHEGFQRGLADYWTSHYVNTVGGHGIWLNQLKPTGALHFWNNNAFHHFRRNGAEPLPDYAFVVTRGLDPDALKVRYGAPQREEEVGPFRIWVFEGEGRRRLNAELARVIGERLEGRWGAEPIFARQK